MNTIMRNTLKSALVLLMIMALLGSGTGQLAARAASLPATPCTGTGTVTCNLWAKTGTATFYGSTSSIIWGYAAAPGDPAGLPGPTLVVHEGETVTVYLTNNLIEDTALLFQGQNLIPDTVGVGAGGVTSYTFTASKPGTYLYEAGLLANAQHQVAMGLYGALVVLPATLGQAYNTAATAYDEETALVLSEFDPLLAANPSGFDMRNYHPRYFLINGKAYPGTAPIQVTAGSKVLLRYVNAGLQSHAMSLVGLSQTLIATDGSPLRSTHQVVSETIAPGQTLDAIVDITALTASGTKFPVYDANLNLRNSNIAGMGGMLTYLAVSGVAPGGDTTGPLTSNIILAPTDVNALTASLAVTASISDAASGAANVDAAEYFIDSTGANGAGTPMAGSYGFPSISVNASLSGAAFTGLATGNHTLYVHGRDSLGNWGAFNSGAFNVDKLGPNSTGLSLVLTPANGTSSVALTATGNDSANGNHNIVAAEYSIAGGPSAVVMAVNAASPIASLSATISTATVNALSDGTHAVTVRSQDSSGNWGATASINLVVDKTGPTASGLTANPSPNNGSTGLSTSVPAVRVTGTFTDALSNVAAGEGFIDTLGVNGTGFVFIATDGVFNTATESGYSDIPLPVIGTLSTGNHNIIIHGKDTAGNWGATSTVVLVIDKLPPSVSGLVLTPAATNNSAVVVSAAANDITSGNSNISAGEYFIDTAGAAGTGTAMTVAVALPSTTISATIPAVTVAALSAGNHTIYVRARDAVGNWSSTISATLLIDRTSPTFSGISLAPNSIPAGTATVALTISGSSDGASGSGVAGGEYWFGSTDITAGTGTAFSGLTTSIATGSLTAGTYTVRVRIRDIAGNWSTGTNGVRTATLTVTAPVADAIFSNGFETGTFSPLTGWSSRSTTTLSRLNISAASALLGSFGLQAQGNSNNFVQYDFGTAANPASPTFDGRFYFNPHGNTDTNQDIFTGRVNSAGTTLFRVVYRWNGGSPQVRLQLGTGTVAANPWTSITNNASNRIEVVWQSGGTLQLFVGGSAAASQTLSATANSVGSVRLGAVSTGGSSSILMYFDGFSAKRSLSPIYGP